MSGWRPACFDSGFAAGGGDEGPDVGHQLFEAVEGHLLGAVAPGFGGVGVDLDDQGIRAHGDGALAHGGDQGGSARALAGVDHDGGVRFLLQDGDDGEIEGVAGVGFEGPDPAFAEEQAGVVVAQDVFAGVEPFLDAHAHAAFEKDGFAGFGGGDEQLEVLRVAGADLEDVGVFGHEVGVVLGEQFGDDGQAGFAAGFGEEFEAFFAETLEFVGGCPGFEGATPEDGGSGGVDGDGGAEQLVFAFDGAGAGHDLEFTAADDDPTGGDGGVGGVGFPADQFVFLLDGCDGFDLGPGGEWFERGVGAFVTYGADDGVGDAAHDVGGVALLADFAEHGGFVLFGGLGLEDNDHVFLGWAGGLRRGQQKSRRREGLRRRFRIRINPAGNAGGWQRRKSPASCRSDSRTGPNSLREELATGPGVTSTRVCRSLGCVSERSRKRRWRGPARGLALVGAVVLVWLVFRRLDLVALGRVLRGMRWGWYLAAQAVFALGVLGSAFRWHLMLRLNHEAVVHGAASVRMVFLSQFFNTLFGGPSGGDVPKTAFYSRWFRVPAADVLAASVLDRLVASLGGLVFIAGAVGLGVVSGAFALPRLERVEVPGRGWWLGGGVLVTVVLAVLGWWVRRPGSFLAKSVASLGRSIGKLLDSKRRSARALGCAVATALLFNLTQILCLQAVSSEPVPVGRLFWMYQVVTMVASMPVTVAGAGLREGASMVLLGEYGISPSVAVAGSLLTLSVHLTWASVGAGLFWREYRLRRGVVGATSSGSISVVIPTLNESAELASTVTRLRAIPEVREVVVADGGSGDGTRELARGLGCRVVESVKGRGRQLRAGVAVAGGDVVMFVHADTWLPAEAGGAVLRCLRDPLVVGGGFWKRFRSPPLVMRGARFRCWLGLWWNGWILGDQAMFVRRSALDAVGGVPEQGLLEEVELCRKLRRRGRLVLAGATVTASERRFTKFGVARTYWRMWRVLRAYRRGVSPDELARRYERG